MRIGPTAGGLLGPYTQSERLHLYKSYADQLLHVLNALKWIIIIFIFPGWTCLPLLLL
jgi:hypothetical protein